MSYYIGIGTIIAALAIFISIARINRAADVYAPPTANANQRPVPADIQEAALRMLRSQGYACNQVYNSFIWLSEPGFTLYCPRWKFLFYENGGRWRIEPRSI